MMSIEQMLSTHTKEEWRVWIDKEMEELGLEFVSGATFKWPCNTAKEELEAWVEEYMDSGKHHDWDDARLKGAVVEILEAFLTEHQQDWQTARGCKIEHECAIAYGIQVYYLY